jgi:hypothetical protein
VEPHLVVHLDPPFSGAVEALLAALAGRSVLRVVLPGDGNGSTALWQALVDVAGVSARRRLRVGRELSAGGLRDAVRAGANELEVPAGGDVPWESIRPLRQAETLRFVTVRVDPLASPDRDGANPCDADEVCLDATQALGGGMPLGDAAAWLSARLRALAPAFRRVAIRGLPPCLVRGLDPAAVIANAIEARGTPPALDVRFEDPRRVYAAPCGRCGLALACDGLPWDALRRGTGGAATLRAFGTEETATVRLSPEGFADRRHPAGQLAGKVHVLGVLVGARPCGRMVLSPAEAERQQALLCRLGLEVAVLGPAEVPHDEDPGATADPRAAAHVFFSRDAGVARAAADLERTFATGAGTGAMQPDAFAREMGRRLGYPGCCVEAFVAAGPAATTADLLRAAHARSRSFDWRLDVLDPRSPVTLVPHVPCRFDCAPSVALAERVLAALPALSPFLDRAAARLLGRTALLAGDDALFLDAPADASGVVAAEAPDAAACRGSAPVGAAVASVLALLGGASQVGVGPDGAMARTGGRRAGVLPGDVRLFPFSGPAAAVRTPVSTRRAAAAPARRRR